jgi:hypothetical protein
MLSRTFAVLMILMSAMPCCTSARASITAFWQPVTITPAAISNDTTLANMQCWDLMVTTTGNWNAAGMGVVLPTGLVFYKHPLVEFIRPDPALFGSSPALEFSTYVSCPSETGTNHTTVVLSAFPQGFNPHLGDLNGRFSMVWADVVNDLPGTYAIARLTFPAGVLAQILHPPGTFSETAQIDPDAIAIIPDIPEPSAFRSSLPAVVLVFARRRFLQGA